MAAWRARSGYLSARFAAACAAVFAALALGACTPEGRDPDTITINGESHRVYSLTSAFDPGIDDLVLAPDLAGYPHVVFNPPFAPCWRTGYICARSPFVFSFPEAGDPPVHGWSAAGHSFRVVGRVPRDFCGRERRVFLVEGADDSGRITRVWYHPDFGVYAVMHGRAVGVDGFDAAHVYTTCQRGLFKQDRRAAPLRDRANG